MNEEDRKFMEQYDADYVSFNRLRGMPWLVRGAVEFLEKVINKESLILEIGSGSSTIWFAEKAGHIISFEDRPRWMAIVLGALATKGIENVSLNYRQGLDVLKPDAQFDVCLIDGPAVVGSYRPRSIEVVPFVKPGGYLVFDNANRPTFKRVMRGINALFWDWRADFIGNGYADNQTGAWTTTIWRKLK